MKKVTITILTFLTFHVHGQSDGGLPFICSVENYECIQGDGPSDVLFNIPSIEDCRQICLDDGYCSFTTYYHSDGFPGKKMCLLFRGCDSVVSCTNCESEDMGCFNMGSIGKVVGTFGENALEAIKDVYSPVTCKEKCSNNQNCQWFTYFYETDDLFPNMCFLQTELLTPALPCDNCLSGSLVDECFILYDGLKNQSSLMFNNTNLDHKLMIFGSDSCNLRVLAIGGGGSGRDDFGGGGGSGYLNDFQVLIPPGTYYKEFQVNVGDANEPSLIIINHKAYRGEPGMDGAKEYGGDGYSGGGWDYGGEGGENGSDGEGEYGGRGTGVDIGKNQFSAFELSPGYGGSGTIIEGHFGGGGGGVVVNGEGPTTSDYDGQGYGGGGGYNYVGSLEWYSWNLSVNDENLKNKSYCYFK